MGAARILLGVLPVWATVSQALGLSTTSANASEVDAWNNVQSDIASNSLLALKSTTMAGYCNSDPVVLVRISTCFTIDAISIIDNWVRNMDTMSPAYYSGEQRIQVKYVAELAEHTSDSLCPIQSPELTHSDLAQQVSFLKLDPANKPDAVISFVSGNAVLKDLQVGMPEPFLSFRVCETCNNPSEKVVFTTLNYFQLYAVSSMSTKALCTTTPKTVVTVVGDNQCACECPEGKVFESGACVDDVPAGNTNGKTCVWGNTGSGYLCEWGDIFVNDKKTSLAMVSDCKVGTLVPRDTYVGDMRVNSNDDLAPGAREKPMIKVDSTDLQGVTKSLDYTWKDYLSNPANSLDGIEFSDFGVYSLTMSASDYKGTATCVGCVAVVDKYPPHAQTPCQTSDFGTVNSPTDLTATSLAEAKTNEVNFHAFSSADNIKNNLPNQLANDEVRKLTDFFETTEKNIDDSLDYCFDSDIVKDLLDKDASKANPFDAGKTETELDSLMCKRCCNKKTVLQEEYIDYKCGQKTFDKHVGVGDSCSFEHCMSIGSTTLVKVSADVVAGVNAEATDAVSNLYTEGDSKKIHRLSICSTIGACGRLEMLDALVNIGSEWQTPIPDVSISNEDYA